MFPQQMLHMRANGGIFGETRNFGRLKKFPLLFNFAFCLDLEGCLDVPISCPVLRHQVLLDLDLDCILSGTPPFIF